LQCYNIADAKKDSLQCYNIADADLTLIIATHAIGRLSLSSASLSNFSVTIACWALEAVLMTNFNFQLADAAGPETRLRRLVGAS
jgi:hypothetical protein